MSDELNYTEWPLNLCHIAFLCIKNVIVGDISQTEMRNKTSKERQMNTTKYLRYIVIILISVPAVFFTWIVFDNKCEFLL